MFLCLEYIMEMYRILDTKDQLISEALFLAFKSAKKQATFWKISALASKSICFSGYLLLRFFYLQYKILDFENSCLYLFVLAFLELQMALKVETNLHIRKCF